MKHGDSKTQLYRCWSGIKQRCNNPNCNTYKNYGAKGIKVDKNWSSDFLVFKNWAISAGYQEGLSIDRKDSSKDYNSDNCRWISLSDNVTSSLKEDYTERKGRFSKESCQKRTKSNRQTNGKSVSLQIQDKIIRFETINDCAKFLSGILEKPRENCRKNLQQCLDPSRNRTTVYGYKIIQEDAS